MQLHCCLAVGTLPHSHLVLQQRSSKLLFLCMRKGGKAKLKAMGSLSLNLSASYHPCELSVPRVPGKWARRQTLFTSPQRVLLPAGEVELLSRGLTLTVWGYLEQNGSRLGYWIRHEGSEWVSFSYYKKKKNCLVGYENFVVLKA